ncbi:DUF6460 domain-containing protein [Pseudochrobactrum asaccharolyticum]|jgi:hypothetical protein|uniref:DUF6460 domain-containing protein n=1 Tax=Pseudochrobactrum asaccharolyticum TaxID=354351 RepID=A0A366E829_9HYPH|nr:DUF6460 domain-containing protein [Pseudochrobactrum asaccharolyticum]MBX8800653.1 hypothetical protein [Ochrobactrum sp. MR28]MBX8817808.1 hypothetical protein [Ochrobactrum sp. MR31]MCF7670759.1 hypothetical protein [Bacillus subtilis]MDR2309866.1 DUF6460 domain-containing protein [Brucellaceae bacterium]MCF7644005.1 hypothetical protein [Pseudochrobactrum asaccharolyticum]
MSDRATRFLGDTPGRVIVKLILVSLVVGVVMHAFNWTPYDILWNIRDFFVRIWNMGFSALSRFADYLLLGAAVVIPAFILLRIINYRK